MGEKGKTELLPTRSYHLKTSTKKKKKKQNPGRTSMSPEKPDGARSWVKLDIVGSGYNGCSLV